MYGLMMSIVGICVAVAGASQLDPLTGGWLAFVAVIIGMCVTVAGLTTIINVEMNDE